METLFNFLMYALFGLFGLLLLVFILAVLFGKRIRKQWEFEADFLDENGREFGEFEIEMSKIEKEEPDYTLKAKLSMRHPALTQHATVQVYIDKTLVIERPVETEGRIYVRTGQLVNTVDQVTSGQNCRVVVGSTQIASAEFHPD